MVIVEVMVDVQTVVIGAGAMGAAAALALARRGHETLVLEQFSAGHDRGSSHGQSRILRYAYFEHPDYARLVLSVAPMWRELERETGTTLMTQCGGIDIGPPDGALVSGSLRACRELGLDHEYLNRKQLESRFPFAHEENVYGVYQPEACILSANDCVRALLDQAVVQGAVLRENARVERISCGEAFQEITTNDEQTVRAQNVVLCVGAWTTNMLGRVLSPRTEAGSNSPSYATGVHPRLLVRRKVVAYFEPADDETFSLGQFPVFIYQAGDYFYYGFPVFGRPGVKIGDHAGGDIVDADDVDRSLRPEDESHVRAFVHRHLAAADGPCVGHDTCLYTLTPDSDFIIDRHPVCDRIVLTCGFSGHGFKFAPVVGEAVADLIMHAQPRFPIDRFRLARLSK